MRKMMKCLGLRSLAYLIAATILIASSACTIAPRLIDHSFGFDTSSDSPDAVVLDYRYGESVMTRAEEWQKKEGHFSQGGGVNGPMPRGDSLYVKWRIKSTGEVYEDTVDLRSRLPLDITGHRIHFIVKGPQLYVYLISPDRRPANLPANGPRRYAYRKVITIYPDQPEF